MINIITKRAPKGGAFGANGEWYEGGKFINTVSENDKRAAKAAQKATGRREIEPWVWAVPPVPGQKTLMSRFQAGAYAHFKNGVACVTHNPNLNREYFNETDEQVQAWVDAYNRGERWS